MPPKSLSGLSADLSKGKLPVRGFRAVVRRTEDVLKGNFNGPVWEFEKSAALKVFTKDKKEIIYSSKDESLELMALASQPNDYVITAIYAVEGSTLSSTEPVVSVVYQPVYAEKGKLRTLNPTFICRSQSGADAVGGVASMFYDVNFVPGGSNGERYVVTKPVTLREAKKAPPEGIAYVVVYGWQSKDNGVIPPETGGIIDHVAINPPALTPERNLAGWLASIMTTHQFDQPYLSPFAAQDEVDPLRKAQSHLFMRAPKEADIDPFMDVVEAKVASGEFLAITDDKADMGGKFGHNFTPEYMLAIDLATTIEAVENGALTDGNIIGFLNKMRLKRGTTPSIGDDSHVLMLGDKSRNSAESHQLSFLAFTRGYYAAVVNGEKPYGLAQDYQGKEAKAAKANPVFYSHFTPRFFEILREVMPLDYMGMVDKMEEGWKKWQETSATIQLPDPFSGNVSQQGIGSARYLVDIAGGERTFGILAGDKMGPAALNRPIREGVYTAIAAAEFANGLVFEIWDAKAFDEDGNIPIDELPELYADVADAITALKDTADQDYIKSCYKEGSLRSDLATGQKERLAQLLKKSGFVPTKRIFLDALKDEKAIVLYLADSDRFNIKQVWTKKTASWDIDGPQAYLDRPILGSSVTKLGILAGGEYIGKDDPVMVGNTKLMKHIFEFFKTNPLIIQGDMNGSHWLAAIPTAAKFAVANKESHPILVGFEYTLSDDGKTLSSVKDIFASKDFRPIRNKMFKFNFEFKRAQVGGQFEPYGTNWRTVEASYPLAKLLRALQDPTSPFLVKNKPETERQRMPIGMLGEMVDLFMMATSNLEDKPAYDSGQDNHAGTTNDETAAKSTDVAVVHHGSGLTIGRATSQYGPYPSQRGLEPFYEKLAWARQERPAQLKIKDIYAFEDQKHGMAPKESISFGIVLEDDSYVIANAPVMGGISAGEAEPGTHPSIKKAIEFFNKNVKKRLIGLNIGDPNEIDRMISRLDDEFRQAAENKEMPRFSYIGAELSIGISMISTIALAEMLHVPVEVAINYRYNEYAMTHNLAKEPRPMSIPVNYSVVWEGGKHGVAKYLNELVKEGVVKNDRRFPQRFKDQSLIDAKDKSILLAMVPPQELQILVFAPDWNQARHIGINLTEKYQALLKKNGIKTKYGAESGFTTDQLRDKNGNLVSLELVTNILEEAVRALPLQDAKYVRFALDIASSEMYIPEIDMYYIGPDAAKNDDGLVNNEQFTEYKLNFFKKHPLFISCEDWADENKPEHWEGAKEIMGTMVQMGDDNTVSRADLVKKFTEAGVINAHLQKPNQSAQELAGIEAVATSHSLGNVVVGSHRGTRSAQETYTAQFMIGAGAFGGKWTLWGPGRGALIAAMTQAYTIFNKGTYAKEVKVPYQGALVLDPNGPYANVGWAQRLRTEIAQAEAKENDSVNPPALLPVSTGRVKEPKVKVAINGFGRIGKLVYKAFLTMEKPNFEIVAVNDLGTPQDLAHLFKYDSTFGKFGGEVGVDGNNLIINGKRIHVYNEKDPANLPWKDLGVDVVIEATGKFTTKEGASKHLTAGAKRVVITAPGEGVDKTLVLGINHEEYRPGEHSIISNASCTTNCLAPVVQVLQQAFGIEAGNMITVHAATNDQNVLDALHKDLARARSTIDNMIPTKTGAAKAIGQVIPALNGKINGMAIRVPTKDVSVVYFTVKLSTPVTKDEVNKAFENAAASGPLKGIIATTNEPLVSSDFLGRPESSIVDIKQTIVSNGNVVTVAAWYDNEWAYSVRTVEMVDYIVSQESVSQPPKDNAVGKIAPPQVGSTGDEQFDRMQDAILEAYKLLELNQINAQTAAEMIVEALVNLSEPEYITNLQTAIDILKQANNSIFDSIANEMQEYLGKRSHSGLVERVRQIVIANSPQFNKLGGIDFRAIPMITQPRGNFLGLSLSLPRLSNVENMNLSEEINEMQKMVQAGIVPSGERLKEYVAACYQKGELRQHLNGIVTFVANLCKLEEEEVVATDNGIKEVMLILDSIS